MLEQLAMDRESARSYDADDRLHVRASNISKSNICPYRGSEIPNGVQLGLDMDKVYYLLRDPDELKKGAPTFNRLPILSRHVPVHAADHRPDLVVGSTGSDAKFEPPYLKNSLVVWDAVYVAAIENGAQKELSSAYRYDADMTPGVYKGQAYDGVMRNIRGNHVALVETGRAGPDVVVGDSALDMTKEEKMPTVAKSGPKQMTRQALFASGALQAYLAPKMAKDQKFDLKPFLKDVTSKNWGDKKKVLKDEVPKLVKGKLAQDASMQDLGALLDMLSENKDEIEDVVQDPSNPDGDTDKDGVMNKDDPDHVDTTDGPATDPVTDPVGDPDRIDPPDDAKNDTAAAMIDKVSEFLSGKISDEDMNALMAILRPEAEDAAPNMKPAMDGVKKTMTPAKTGVITQAAMDAAMATAAKTAEKNTIARLQAIQVAQDAVMPHIGKLANVPDTATAIYKMALDAAEVDLTDVPATAFPALVRMLPKPGVAVPSTSPARVAMDATQVKEITSRIPNISRLKHR